MERPGATEVVVQTEPVYPERETDEASLSTFTESPPPSCGPFKSLPVTANLFGVVTARRRPLGG